MTFKAFGWPTLPISAVPKLTSSLNIGNRGSLCFAVLFLVMLITGCSYDRYPDALKKYIPIIETTEGADVDFFKTDVSDEVCPFFDPSDFQDNYGKHGDLEVRRIYFGDDVVYMLLLTRSLGFMRGLVISIGEADSCSAFVEQYFL